MTETDHTSLQKQIKFLENELASSRAKQSDLLSQFGKLKKRVQIARNGYLLERDKRIVAEKAIIAIKS